MGTRAILRGLVSLGLGGFVIAMVGCASAPEDADSSEAEIRPEKVKTREEQLQLCSDRVKENGASRAKDLDTGVVRWRCGDVNGVNDHKTNDFGQEYCEFHAVAAGAVVDRPTGPVTSSDVQCVFTAIYKDVKPADQVRAFGENINQQLANDPKNLTNAAGKKLPDQTGANGPVPFSVMRHRFNSRGAANGLLSSCSGTIENEPEVAARVNKAPDNEVCDDVGCSTQRDVEACSVIFGQGEGWRNSDPIICGRVARAQLCGAKVGALPPSLDGFLMTDWEADPAKAVAFHAGKSSEVPSAPERCKYATIDGKPYLHILICQPSEDEVDTFKSNGQGLQAMCSEVFGPKIAMTAPIGLVMESGSDPDRTCKQLNGGLANLKSMVK